MSEPRKNTVGTADQPRGRVLASANRPTDRPLRLPKRLAFRALAVLLGALAGFALAECGTRLLGIEPTRYPPPEWMVLSDGEYRNWGLWGRGLIKRPSRFQAMGVEMGEYVPGATMKVAYASNPRGYFDSDNGIVMQINSLGFRGPEIPLEKPQNVYRILGLGDSFTFGVGVREEDTFLRRLESSLNDKATDELSFQVINAGTQGYNTRDEVLYLEHRWLVLQPDLVLINFYLNDAYTDAAFLNNGEGLGLYFQPEGLARVSRLYDLAQHKFRCWQAQKAMEEYYRNHYFSRPAEFFQSPSSRHVDWHVCGVAIQRAMQLAEEKEFRIALVVFPEFQNLDGVYPFDAIHQLIRESCASMDLPVLDLIDVFRGMRDEDLWVHPSDHHPNEVAHRLAGEAIESFIRERFLTETP
jgi:hypothetical protein